MSSRISREEITKGKKILTTKEWQVPKTNTPRFAELPKYHFHVTNINLTVITFYCNECERFLRHLLTITMYQKNGSIYGSEVGFNNIVHNNLQKTLWLFQAVGTLENLTNYYHYHSPSPPYRTIQLWCLMSSKFDNNSKMRSPQETFLKYFWWCCELIT